MLGSAGNTIAKIGKLATGPWGTAGMLAVDALPLITDATGGEPDQSKIDALVKWRDAQAAQLAGSTGMPLAKAQAQIDDQIKPLLDSIEAGEPPSAGKVGADAAGVGITSSMLGYQLLHGKKGKTDTGTPGAGDARGLPIAEAEPQAPSHGTAWDANSMELEPIAPEIQMQQAPELGQAMAPESHQPMAPETGEAMAPESPVPGAAHDVVPPMPEDDPHAYADIKQMMVEQAAKRNAAKAATKIATTGAEGLGEIGEILGTIGEVGLAAL